MANMVNLTIDGKKVQAPEGTNLIEAAAIAGVHIPNLCYLKGMKAVGACRLCMVEVEGMKAPMVGCTTKVKDGMVINTRTEKILEMRKFVIDLILSMHPLDCMTCTKAGVCNLQQYAYDFGIRESSFTRKKFGFSVDESNPFIKRDPDYCVLCGRCVRACRNQGTNVLDFMGRGVGSKVSTATDKPLQESGCTFCGSCLDACPVNALLEADRWRKGREWEYEKTASACLLCGNSCSISVSTRNGSVAKITSAGVDGSAEDYICAYGRFGFDCLEGDTRVMTPMKKVNGKLEETTWEDALDIVAKGLKKAGKNAGFISTAGILNEDLLTLGKFAGEVVKTKNVDTTASLYSDRESLLSESADLETADLFIMVDIDANQWTRVLPALDSIVRKRVNSGAKLIVINSSETANAGIAEVSLIGDEIAALKGISKSLIDKGLKSENKLASAVSDATVSEAAEKAAALIAESKNPVILSSPAMYQASANLSLLKGTAVSLPLESNAKGAALMGVKTNGMSFGEMVKGGVSLLYVIGEVPVTNSPKVEFLVVQNSHLTELAKQADVVLPSAAYLESSGTIIDYLGRLRHVEQAVEPAGGSMAHREILAAVAKAMGSAMKESKEAEAKKLAKVKVKSAFAPFEKKAELDINESELIESLNASVIVGSRLLWLKESEKALA